MGEGEQKQPGRRRQGDDLTVNCECVVVDGPEGEELGRRQAAAILEVLRYLYESQGGCVGGDEGPRLQPNSP